jgi:(p)ppGpp synthase/HD superfamily hydrolase
MMKLEQGLTVAPAGAAAHGLHAVGPEHLLSRFAGPSLRAMTLTARFDLALQYTALVHAGQTRKGGGTPYLAHLLGVASLALEYGADEDEAIAALLHDAVEDAGGAGRLADIRGRFGGRVAEIVWGCTDSDATPKAPWRERKEAYLARVPELSASARLVSAADKLHNSRAYLRRYRQAGESIWADFQGGRAGTLWYLRAVTAAFQQGGSTALIGDLDLAVTELELLVSTSTAKLA